MVAMFTIETYYAPEYGSIAVMYDNESGEVVATGYDPPMPDREEDA